MRDMVPKTSRATRSQCKIVETIVFAEGIQVKEKVGMGNEGSYRAPLYTP
jgi:hypothetical protein